MRMSGQIHATTRPDSMRTGGQIHANTHKLRAHWRVYKELLDPPAAKNSALTAARTQLVDECGEEAVAEAEHFLTSPEAQPKATGDGTIDASKSVDAPQPKFELGDSDFRHWYSPPNSNRKPWDFE